jgi:cytochrome c2
VEYGCGFCHVIPGVPEAEGTVAMSLEDWGDRRILAGEFPNDISNLVEWIQDPTAMRPGTAMPNLGVTEQDARDMAQYLFTLRRVGQPAALALSFQHILDDLFREPDPVESGTLTALEERRGWEIFARYCAECHGFGMEGVRGSIPRLALSSLLVNEETGRLYDLILAGHAGFQGLSEWITDEELLAVIEFMQSFAR